MKNKKLANKIAHEVRATIECGGIDTLQEMMADIDFYIDDVDDDIDSMAEFKRIERLVLVKLGDVNISL